MRPDPSSQDHVAMEMRNKDVERHLENLERHGSLYDAWDDESPASVSHRFSDELRKRLKGENPDD